MELVAALQVFIVLPFTGEADVEAVFEEVLEARAQGEAVAGWE